jgi:hypothetical protein
MTAGLRLCYGTIRWRTAKPARTDQGAWTMATIELTAEEAGRMAEILENYLSDLRMEIVDTESQVFRDGLKTTKELVMRVIDQLKAVRA